MTFNVTALILRQEDWRETDAWVTMYTRERGKIEALAKGLRKIESKLASHLEPFMTAEIFLAQGRHWPIVAGSIVEQARLGLRDNFDRLSLAGAIARLADLMTPLESRDDNIYDVLDETLAIIESNHLKQSAGELLLHLFAWKLLVFSGYHPELKFCLRCKRNSIIGEAYLDIRRGGAIHESCIYREAPRLYPAPPRRGGLHRDWGSETPPRPPPPPRARAGGGGGAKTAATRGGPGGGP